MKSAEVAEQSVRQAVERIDPAYFTSKRWFGSKSRTITGCRLVDLGLLDTGPDFSYMLIIEILYADAEPQLYHVPLVLAPRDRHPEAIRQDLNAVAFVMPTEHGELWACDALAQEEFCVALYRHMYDGREVSTDRGVIAAFQIPGRIERRDPRAIRPITSEQSNSSIVYDDQLILKLFRQLAPGSNPDLEVPYFLTTRTDFEYIAKVAGYMEYQPASGEPISVALLQDFVSNEGDCYTNALQWVREYCDQVLEFVVRHPGSSPEEQKVLAAGWTSGMQARVHRMGFITGSMHNALASSEDPEAFRPESITRQDVERWESGIVGDIRSVIAELRERTAGLPPEQRELIEAIAAGERRYLGLIRGLGALEAEGRVKIRCHGDYHLGQLLQTGDNFIVIDFEGEPARNLAERRAKNCPLRDVAGLLRSFDYAAYGALFELWQEQQSDDEQKAMLETWVRIWEDLACTAFMVGYQEAVARNTGPQFVPSEPDTFARIVRIFEIEKAFYELVYELNNRPAWLPIPARGLLRTLSAD